MADPEMTEVESSHVHSVGHDGGALLVRFRGPGGAPGALYRYPGAGAEHYQAMTSGIGAGAYVHTVLRRRFTGEKVRA